MVDVPRPESGAFLLLETLHRDKTGSRTIHLARPAAEKPAFKLGRGHESDIRVADISVSRLHTVIRCAKDGVFIEDNQSKFGTLVYAKGKLELSTDNSFAMQIGRTIISLCVQPRAFDRHSPPAHSVS